MTQDLPKSLGGGPVIYSGAELIKSSGDIKQRYISLAGNSVEGVKPVQATNSQAQSSEDDARGALLRFAKFVKGESNKPKEESSDPEMRKPLPRTHRAFRPIAHERGTMIDIYA